MKNFNFSKVIIIVLLISIASLSSITISSKNYRKSKEPNTLIKVINDVTGSADNFLAIPGNFLQSKLKDFSNVLNTYSQNESMKKKMSEMTMQDQRLDALEQENKELKEALEMQSTLANYQLQNVSIISRNPSSWNDLIVIDKGEKSGLASKMLVLSEGGVVGFISQVNANTSKVELFSESDNLVNKIPVKISENYCLLTDFDEKRGEFIVTNLYSIEDIEVGDKVVTSGLDGKTPSDLLFGEISEIQKSSSISSTKIYVKPASNFNDLHFATVILPE
ncbi:MAG: rod shape-determining protein MreC [Lactovum sp.]